MYRPQVRRGYDNILGKRPVATAADADRTIAQVPSSRATITADAAGNMALSSHPIPNGIAGYARSDLDNLADKLMPDDPRCLNITLRPVVPVEDMQICAADAGLQNLYQYFIRAD